MKFTRFSTWEKSTRLYKAGRQMTMQDDFYIRPAKSENLIQFLEGDDWDVGVPVLLFGAVFLYKNIKKVPVYS